MSETKIKVTVRLHTTDPGEDFTAGLVEGSDREAWLIEDDDDDRPRMRTADGQLLGGIRIVPGVEKLDWGAVGVPAYQLPSRPWLSVCRAEDGMPLFSVEVPTSPLGDGDGVQVLGEIRAPLLASLPGITDRS